MRILDQLRNRESRRRVGQREREHHWVECRNNSFRSYSDHFFFLSCPFSSSIIINSFSHSFIIVICSVQCALLAVLSAFGLCHQRFVPQSLCLITLTELICREMLRPERLAIGQFHLILQPQAVTLRGTRERSKSRQRQEGR